MYIALGLFAMIVCLAFIVNKIYPKTIEIEDTDTAEVPYKTEPPTIEVTQQEVNNTESTKIEDAPLVAEVIDKKPKTKAPRKSRAKKPKLTVAE